MHPDFEDLLSSFHAHDVPYRIVGGYAVSFDVQPRAAKDLDLLIHCDPANAKKTSAALASFGAPLDNVDEKDFANPDQFPRLGQEPVGIDRFCLASCQRPDRTLHFQN